MSQETLHVIPALLVYEKLFAAAGWDADKCVLQMCFRSTAKQPENWKASFQSSELG
jgi:hypothetical protein